MTVPTLNRGLPPPSSFTDIDLTDTSNLINDSTLTRVDNTNVQYEGASALNPTGVWYANGQRITAGELVSAKMYQTFLSAETTAQKHLSAMATNASFAKAASAFAKELNTTSSLSYADLITKATPLVTDLGVTPAEFLTSVLPTVTSGTTYTSVELKALIPTVEQYANSRLTDNSILQNKFNIATSNRTLTLDGLSNFLKGWTSFLQGLERNI